MTFPAVTTLQQIITLAHQQYGIRFQLSTTQLVAFANMIQMIAYNQDMAAFEEWNQKLYFGQDAFGTQASYTAPADTDIGKVVTGSTTSTFGTLMNFKTSNRLHHWVIEPNDGTKFALIAGETLTIVGGSVASLVVAEGQSYPVSNGPYRVPRLSLGNPPFRKLIGVTRVTDKQVFGVPASDSASDPFDYGLNLNYFPERKVNTPLRWDEVRKEITLVTTAGPEITLTASGAASPNMLNDSDYRWAYYINPPTITDISDESSLILPEEYRYEVLYKGISLLADTATYGDYASVRQLIDPLCSRFWEDKGVQFQAFGKANDWISHGDSWDQYGSGQQGNWHSHGLGDNWA